MTDVAEVSVEMALIDRLVALTASPAISLALPNVKHDPPAASRGVYWLRATFLPVPSLALAIGFAGTVQHSGIFQVDVFHAQGDGEHAPARIAADVIDWFKLGTTLTKNGYRVQVIRAPYRSRMLKDDPWMMIAVSIPYVTFAPPT